MAIEIRELIIKTEITTGERAGSFTQVKEKQFEKMKKQVLQEVKRMMTMATKRNNNKR